MTKPVILTLAACLAAVPAFSAAPAIAAQGVKNAASYADPQLPNGAIAEGSIFNIFGSNMGPTALAYATSLPLPTTLSGTSINVTVSGTTVQCYMFYTSAGQVAAILPSTTPVGTGTISVSYNGTASPTAPITVAKSSFGIFTVNQQGSGPGVILDGKNNGNAPTFAFQPGETVVAWGTGLGPISGSDATTPPSGNLPGITVAVTIGGVSATVAYAGRSGYAGEDQVDFTIPTGVTGCFVPVDIAVTNGATTVLSNFATMSIGNTTTCTSPQYPNGYTPTSGTQTQRTGSVLFFHSVSTSPLPNATGVLTPTTITADAGEAGFYKITSTSSSASGYDLNYGACVIINNPPTGSVTSTGLNAGPVISVNGQGGAMQMTASTFAPSSFYTTFGGPPTTLPLYFSPGTYTANNGSGGSDVGGFNVNITVPAPFTWTNYSSITSVTRSQGLTANWTGGDSSWDVYLIGNSSVADGASVSFECRAHVSDQTLTVPASVLEALPPSATNGGIPSGALTMLVETPNPLTSTVSGLDFFTYGYSVEYQNGGLAYK
jgi:uncharacterized protein (TIGR03437 family)